MKITCFALEPGGGLKLEAEVALGAEVIDPQLAETASHEKAGENG
jgi:hypothetical protein